MSSDVRSVIRVWVVILLAISPANSIYALCTWSDSRLDQEWELLLALWIPAMGYLYWPVKWHLANLRRTAPQREHTRSLARQAATERENHRRARRDEADRRRRERLHAENERLLVVKAKWETETF